MGLGRDVELIPGGIDTVVCLTDEAADWVDEHLGDETEWCDPLTQLSFYSEPSYTPEIIHGMLDSGLGVWIGEGRIESVS